MLRKSLASDALAAISKNSDFFKSPSNLQN